MLILTIYHINKKRELRKVKRTKMKKQLFSLGILLFCLGGFSLFFSIAVQADPGWIQVSNPTGGTWYSGDIMSISWISSNAGNSVDIILFLGSSQSITIASNFPNYGSTVNYDWLIPMGIPSGSSCRIKVVSTSNQSIYAFSSYFTLKNRFISLYSPTTGDTWYGDEAHSISWTSENIPGSVQLSLYAGDTRIMIISSNVPCSQGTYPWNVPSTINSGSSYRIRTEAIGYGSISSYSSYFSIKKRTITVTAPTTDTVWYPGESYQIAWVSDHAGASVDISLYEKNTHAYDFRYLRSIMTGTDNDGRQTWTVPSSLSPSSSYRIYIVSTSYASVSNYSEVFRVEERYISVSSPKNNDTWYIGEVYNITWTSKNAGEMVTIDLYQNGVQQVVLASNITNDGVFPWMVPLETTPDASSQIKIRSSTITTVYGISDPFSLLKKFVEVISPAETELWYKGERHVITWDAKGFSSKVKIELFVDAAIAMTIADNVDNSGRYEWAVPLDVSSGSMYTIKITSVSDESIYGYSSGLLIIESTFLQQWSGAIILFSVVSVGFVVAYIVIIRKWRRRIALEEASRESGVVEGVPEQLTDEEYENIWERNRE
jgi:hypothetical protein